VAFQRREDSAGPVRPQPIEHLEEHRSITRRHLASGTLACPECDAPVSALGGPLSPADGMACPFCGHAARVRDFLSLAVPSRPAHVQIRIVQRRT
jgi:uncharacterized paraquat-inducible protein A